MQCVQKMQTEWKQCSHAQTCLSENYGTLWYTAGTIHAPLALTAMSEEQNIQPTKVSQFNIKVKNRKSHLPKSANFILRWRTENPTYQSQPVSY